jgi:hypothetical protein
MSSKFAIAVSKSFVYLHQCISLQSDDVWWIVRWLQCWLYLDSDYGMEYHSLSTGCAFYVFGACRGVNEPIRDIYILRSQSRSHYVGAKWFLKGQFCRNNLSTERNENAALGGFVWTVAPSLFCSTLVPRSKKQCRIFARNFKIANLLGPLDFENILMSICATILARVTSLEQQRLASRSQQKKP